MHISDNGRPQRRIFTSMREKPSVEYPQSLQSNNETSTIELPTGADLRSTDRFPKPAPKAQGSRGCEGMLPLESFWILTPLSRLSWVSEAYR